MPTAFSDNESGDGKDNIIDMLGGDDTYKGRGGDDTIEGGDGNDSLTGNDGADSISGGADDDRIFGKRHDDTLIGNDGRDVIKGGTGNDQLIGGADKDILNGDADNDLLKGGNGNDILKGEDGDDTLIGGSGDDVLKGGTGTNTYIFTAGSGLDEIFDFQPDIDLIDLTGYASAGIWSMDDLTFKQSGTKLLIKFDGQTIVLKNTLLTEIDEDDFVFRSTGETISEIYAPPTDSSFHNVASGGDIDGDGINDLLIGSRFGGEDENGPHGLVYVIYGNAIENSEWTLDAGTLSADQGVVISGISGSDYRVGFSGSDNLGWSISSVDDIDGDGLDEVLIGAPFADPLGIVDAGAAYLIYGRTIVESGGTIDLNDMFGQLTRDSSGALDTSGLNPNDGLIIIGDSTDDRTGKALSSAGDVDGDGITDLLIGVYWGGDRTGVTNSGEAHLIYGSQIAGRAAISIGDVTPDLGVVISGADDGDHLGTAVADLGDLNGDGYDDILLGAHLADPNGINRAGESYFISGRALVESGGSLDVAALTLDQGVVIEGWINQAESGLGLSAAGDVDGDGIMDLLIGGMAGAYRDSPEYLSHQAIVFGSALFGRVGNINLGQLSEGEGVVIVPAEGGDQTGFDIADAGDIDGDGYDDILITAPRGDTDTFDAGKTYLLWGSALRATGTTFDLADLTSDEGVEIWGASYAQRMGVGAQAVGDITGDGIDDIVISSTNATEVNDGVARQTVYVIPTDLLSAERLDDGIIDLGDQGFFV